MQAEEEPSASTSAQDPTTEIPFTQQEFLTLVGVSHELLHLWTTGKLTRALLQLTRVPGPLARAFRFKSGTDSKTSSSQSRKRKHASNSGTAQNPAEDEAVAKSKRAKRRAKERRRRHRVRDREQAAEAREFLGMVKANKKSESPPPLSVALSQQQQQQQQPPSPASPTMDIDQPDEPPLPPKQEDGNEVSSYQLSQSKPEEPEGSLVIPEKHQPEVKLEEETDELCDDDEDSNLELLGVTPAHSHFGPIIIDDSSDPDSSSESDANSDSGSHSGPDAHESFHQDAAVEFNIEKGAVVHLQELPSPASCQDPQPDRAMSSAPCNSLSPERQRAAAAASASDSASGHVCPEHWPCLEPVSVPDRLAQIARHPTTGATMNHHEMLTVKSLDGRSLKRLALATGLSWRRGPFSKAETAILRRHVDRFKILEGVNSEEMLQSLEARDKPPIVRDFMLKLLAELQKRSWNCIYKKLCYDLRSNSRSTGRWSSAESQSLRELVQLHGIQWKVISKEMPGRDHRQCAAHWYNVAGHVNLKSGPWTQEEQAQLQRSMLQGARGPERRQTSRKIDWVWVAQNINQRTPNQCRREWKRMEKSQDVCKPI